MADRFDVAIVGGGLNGPLCALACAALGLRVVVLDAAPAAAKRDPDFYRDFDGRAYAISSASGNLLSALGLWNDLAKDACPIVDIKVSHGTSGAGASPYFVHFDSAEVQARSFGHMLEDRHLRRHLVDAMSAAPLIDYKPASTVLDFATGSAEVTLTTRGPRGGTKSISSRLLIGADGRGSDVARLAGIARLGWDYSQASLVCAIEHELPHNGTAQQFFSGSGPLALLPLNGNRSSVVWTEERNRAQAIQERDEAGYLEALKPVVGDFLGDLQLAGKRGLYPLGLSLAESFVRPRIALIGDAAHGIHPLAGQGLNLGFRDIAALIDVLAMAQRRGEDLGSIAVLERYQQWRRADTLGMAVATDSINRIFLGSNPLLTAGRDAAIAGINALPGLRRMFMREATGTAGDMPKLLQGLQP